jgi:hypothetical protein
MGTNTGIPGLSFSWRRALGITKLKRHIAKTTGIPTTRSGRQRKIGRFLTSGCGTLIAVLTIPLIIPILILAAILNLTRTAP